MKSRAGLKKQIKTVQGGGKRTYWVRSDSELHQKTRRGADAGLRLGVGLGHLGQSIGGMAGSHYGSEAGARITWVNTKSRRAEVAGALVGAFAGRHYGGRLGKHTGQVIGYNVGKKMSARAERNLAHAAHIGAYGLDGYQLYKAIKAFSDRRR